MLPGKVSSELTIDERCLILTAATDLGKSIRLSDSNGEKMGIKELSLVIQQFERGLRKRTFDATPHKVPRSRHNGG